MIHLHSETTEAGILQFIRQWTKLLAHNQWQQAASCLNEHPAEGLPWTAEAWQQVFLTEAEHRGPITPTDPSLMDISKERFDFFYFNDGTGFAVDDDLPINGQWSDLTAPFEFRKKGAALALHQLDIQVL